MPDFDGFGEEYHIEIDVDFDAGGAWGTANWVELAGAPKVDRSPGIISAEFVDREKKQKAHRRSKIRDVTLDIECYVKPGNAAFDRIREAADDAANLGAEILHVRVTEGDPTVAGNKFWEADFVVTEPGAPSTGFGEGSTVTYQLKSAADSVNTPVVGVTS